MKEAVTVPLEIDAASNLYLPSEGDGDREAFARIFGDVWFTIPERFRKSMVAAWRKGISGQESSPVIQLVRGDRYAGGNEAFGHTLLFNADVARLMQDRHLRRPDRARIWARLALPDQRLARRQSPRNLE